MADTLMDSIAKNLEVSGDCSEQYSTETLPQCGNPPQCGSYRTKESICDQPRTHWTGRRVIQDPVSL